MNVNKNRLEEVISVAVQRCEECPIADTSFCKLNTDGEEAIFNCEECVKEWLQNFDVVEVLEEGGHIVNDKAIFPPEEIPYQPTYGTPCEQVGRPCNVNCPYYWEDCPYE